MSDRLIAMYGNPEGWSGVSASGVGPTEECPARAALPAVRTTGAAAKRGTELHEFARIITINPTARARSLLNLSEEHRATAAGMNIAAALDGLRVVGCETAYALDAKARKTRKIGVNINRDYEGELARQGQPPLRRYEIPFSIDVEAMYDSPDGEIPVELDYKSGKHIGAVSEHGQRSICAIGLMLFYDTPSAISRVAYVREDGSIVPDGHEFVALDVDDFCDRCVRMIDAVWKARAQFSLGIMPTVNPSDTACNYCPAMDSCPYFTNLAKGLLGRLEDIEKGPELSTLTPAEKLTVWEVVKKSIKIASSLEDRLKTMALTEPFGDENKVVAPSWRDGKVGFDATSARGLIFKLLADQGKSDEEIRAVIAGLSKQGKGYPVFSATKRKAA